MKKKLLPALLALVMVLGMLPLAVFAAADDEEESGGESVAFTIPDSDPGYTDTGLTDGHTGQGEGTAPDGAHQYTVTAWLYYAKNALSGLKSANGVVKKAGPSNTAADATKNLNGAETANDKSAEDAKGQLATLIGNVKTEFATVKKLDFATNAANLNMTDFGCLVPFTGLEELDISGNKITNEKNGGDLGVIPQRDMSGVFDSNLKVLKMANCGLTNINALSGCTALEELDISGNPQLTERTGDGTNAGKPIDGITALANCTALKKLDISSTGIKDLAALANSTNLTSLTAKNLKGVNLLGLAALVNKEGFDESKLTIDFEGSTLDENLTTAQKAAVNDMLEKLGTTGLTKYDVPEEPTTPSGDEIVITGANFMWTVSAQDKTTLKSSGINADSWKDQTMYVTFNKNLPNEKNVWFKVEINGQTWGCNATGDGNHKTYAFSFLNLGQWEQQPQNASEYGLSGSEAITANVKVYDTGSSALSEGPAADELESFTSIGSKDVGISAKPNANSSLKIEKAASDVNVYSKMHISGMANGKCYMIRLADSKADQENMTILVVENNTESGTYDFYCLDSQNIWVLEFASKSNLNAQLTTGKLIPTSQVERIA